MSISSTTVGGFFRRPITGSWQSVGTSVENPFHLQFLDLAAGVTRISIQLVNGPDLFITKGTPAVDDGFRLQVGDMITFNWEAKDVDGINMIGSGVGDSQVYIVQEGI